MKPGRATRKPPARAADFDATFEALRAVLAPLAKTMRISADAPGTYTLLAQPTPKCPDGMFFASVRTGKGYVSSTSCRSTAAPS